jgi:enoyl-CoA hydratase/carnithine racemase
VVGVLRGARPGPTYLLRGDMDALPVHEDSGLDFASEVPGVMHACGHDTHVAMLLGAARLLSERRDSLAGQVVFMVQPGEEGFHGARFMLEEGLLDVVPEAPVSGAFALHISTMWRSGTINVRPGPMMASADQWTITVRGRGGHASTPHLAADPVPVAAEIVLALQSMITRRTDVFDPAVVTVGHLEAGTTDNIIPATALVHGTIRTLSAARRADVLASVQRVGEHVAVVEFNRPPNNFFSVGLVAEIAGVLERMDQDPSCRALVLCSAGKHFCAGADFSADNPAGASLYDGAARFFEIQTPLIAAVQGAAIGGGLGVALTADFRVATPETRFAANFARIGIHHGFAITVTLPLVVGHQRALEMLYTGARLRGEQAHAIGLCDRIVPAERLRDEAIALAEEVVLSAPLAVRSIKATMRGPDLAARAREAMAHEAAEQAKLFATQDFKEGVAAYAERRRPDFQAK